ncbi:ABC transporter ATP-binding protein [Xanthobacter autotrophicus]|jgi:branched-chain amino acid transport system ATP-binding protein|uniref:ABC transporter ATP-binding protein n=1 Tax=Xanthobacter autotrophicus TaxID=280 RepID=A0A6C1KF63_XANAU|nr:ABC transporter ATP-binding protein [Xanthobacter autotrophicus]TLX42832.1 ABC transporter ATP-binding protein [Xanthobacter autotrophicus]
MNALLQADAIAVTFGGLKAVDGVSFTLKAGEIIGLIGPNGAGKTTLFNALVGLQPLTSGKVVLDGDTVSGLKPHKVAAKGMTKTFQNAALFPDMSVVENVMTAALLRHDLAGARMRAEQVLDKLGLSPIAEADVADLTFPQKALVEMARALATEPRVLLLDEVMAALTPNEMDEVMDVIRALKAEGLSFLVVEHHMRAIMALCDRLLVVNFGRLIAQGTPAEVAANPAVIEAYLGHGAAGKEAAHG